MILPIKKKKNGSIQSVTLTTSCYCNHDNEGLLTLVVILTQTTMFHLEDLFEGFGHDQVSATKTLVKM